MPALSLSYVHFFFTKKTFISTTCSATFWKNFQIRSFGIISWVPLHFRSKKTRLLSYYALSQGWLPPSLPLSCQSSIIFFFTEINLRSLAYVLGCFPFDLEPSRSRSDYFSTYFSIRSFLEFGRVRNPPHSLSALPLK
jgi:hypothetical protein